MVISSVRCVSDCGATRCRTRAYHSVSILQLACSPEQVSMSTCRCLGRLLSIRPATRACFRFHIYSRPVIVCFQLSFVVPIAVTQSCFEVIWALHPVMHSLMVLFHCSGAGRLLQAAAKRRGRDAPLLRQRRPRLLHSACCRRRRACCLASCFPAMAAAYRVLHCIRATLQPPEHMAPLKVDDRPV
jgi:hypothetical protein